ncbi:hypothetical protein [Rosistilla oblonga]|uniref:hypothetical protein n=1 Tax=Rosistilla oblonga TaxID=2527990 RepID=UPI003A9769D8
MPSISQTLNVTCQLDYDDDQRPWNIGRLSVDRHESLFRCAMFDDSSPGIKPSSCSITPQPPGEAWDQFVDPVRCADLNVFVGPGPGPVVFDNLVVEPVRYQVFDAKNATPELIDKPWHRFEAMQLAKDIVARGGCPVVVGYHLEPESDWDSAQVAVAESVV